MQRGVSRPPRRGCAAQHTRPCTIGVLCRVIQVFDYAFCVVAVKSQRVTCLVASVCGFGFVSAVLRSVQTFDFKTRGTLELAKLPCHCADATPKMACLESRLTALNFRLAKAKDVHSRGVCRQTNLDRPSRKKNARRAIRRQTADAACECPSRSSSVVLIRNPSLRAASNSTVDVCRTPGASSPAPTGG